MTALRSLAALLVAVSFAAPLAAQDEQDRAGGIDADKLLELLEKAAVEGSGDKTRWMTTELKTSRDRAAAAELAVALDERRVSVNFDRTPFSEAIDFVRDVTGLNIVVSKKASEELEEREVTLRLKKVTLRSCFELLLELGHEELRYGVRHGVLWLGLASEWPKVMVLKIIDVSDITAPIPNFPAPELGLKTGGFKWGWDD